MKIELLKKLNIELGYELSEFVESGHDEIGDYCHEYADGCEEVIYYVRAEELYGEASTEERDEAEAMVEDCGGFGEGADMAKRFALLAYWITRSRRASAISEQAGEAYEAIDEMVAELDEIKDIFSDLS